MSQGQPLGGGAAAPRGCWVRKEYTHNHEKYHGEFLHAMAIAVTTMPTRCLSFQVIFTGIPAEGEEDCHAEVPGTIYFDEDFIR